MELSRRANSFPDHALATLAGSLHDVELLPANSDVRFVTSPSFVEPRSPPTITAFSPVFDLELGGTPQEQQPPKTHASQLRRMTLTPVAFRQLPAATSLAPAAGRQQLNAARAAAAGPTPGAVNTGGLDRSQSDLQVVLGQHLGAKGAAVGPLDPAAERLHELSKPATDLELELSHRLRAFRSARIAKPHATAPPSASTGTPAQPTQVTGPASATGTTASPGPGGGPVPGEIEALAFELQSEGFLVQILDGQRLGKDARACLRTLKHRFLVCLGRGSPPQRRSLQGHERRLEAPQVPAAPQQRLTEPLVVEVRFREQFLIANPTRDYERLLLVLPVVFVGPLRRLDAVVELMAGQVAAVFREAHRSLPPWRTKGAMLSKWAPQQLMDMERMLKQMAAQQQEQQQQQQGQGKQRGCEQELQTEVDRSWGSGIADLPGCGPADTEPQSVSEPLCVAAAAAAAAAVPVNGCATPTDPAGPDGPSSGLSSGLVSGWEGRSAALLTSGIMPGIMGAVAGYDTDQVQRGMDWSLWAGAAGQGCGFRVDGSGSSAGVVPRCTSAPPRSLRTPQQLAAALGTTAAAGDGDGHEDGENSGEAFGAKPAVPTPAAPLSAPALGLQQRQLEEDEDEDALQQQEQLAPPSFAESGLGRAQMLLESGGGGGLQPEDDIVTGEAGLRGAHGLYHVDTEPHAASVMVLASERADRRPGQGGPEVPHGRPLGPCQGADLKVESAAVQQAPRTGEGSDATPATAAADGTTCHGLTFPVLPEAAIPAMATAQVLLGGPLAPPRQTAPAQQGQGQGEQPSSGSGSSGGEVLLRVPSLPPPPRSAFSPFASVSMPEVSYDDGGDGAAADGVAVLGGPNSDDGGCGGSGGAGLGAPTRLRDQHPNPHPSFQQCPFADHQQQYPHPLQMDFQVGSGGSSCGALPEFTLKHSALALPVQHYDQDFSEVSLREGGQGGHGQDYSHIHLGRQQLPYHEQQQQSMYDTYGGRDVGHRDAVGGMCRGGAATLPMPTPPRAGVLRSADDLGAAAPAAAAAGGGGGGLAAVRMGSPDAALKHQPLAAAAIGAGVQRDVDASRASGMPYTSTGATTSGAPGSFPLQFPKPDGLRITRRSSSDLSRAANKFKNAKSLLAAALRRATGTGGGGNGGGGATGAGSAGASAAATAAGGGAIPGLNLPVGQSAAPQGDQQRRLPLPATQPLSPPMPPPPAAAVEAASAALLPAAAGGGARGSGDGAKQVALTGGVLTRASEKEPAWARIATLRWDQPAPAGRQASGATRGAYSRVHP